MAIKTATTDKIVEEFTEELINKYKDESGRTLLGSVRIEEYIALYGVQGIAELFVLWLEENEYIEVN